MKLSCPKTFSMDILKGTHQIIIVDALKSKRNVKKKKKTKITELQLILAHSL